MKKLLFGLFISILWFIGFSSAFDISCSDSSFTVSDDSYFIINFAHSNRAWAFFQIYTDWYKFVLYYNSYYWVYLDTDSSSSNITYPIILNPWTYYLDCDRITSSSFSIVSAITSCPDCPICPSLSWYILESSVDTQYCMLNNLCPSSWECTIEGSWFSNVYVYSDNNYFPLTWTSNIYVNLPSFLWYTYNYSDNWSDLDIDVENDGNEEYIQSVIDINSYRPTSEDFTDTFVSGLTLVMPYIVIVLFIVFVWKLLKKIFR